MKPVQKIISTTVIALLFLVLINSQTILAGGWSNQATISKLELVRGQGVAIFGNFGNPAGCTQSYAWWINKNHPQYDKLYSMLMAAMLSDKKIRGYAHGCEEFGWHGGSFNTISGPGALYMIK